MKKLLLLFLVSALSLNALAWGRLGHAVIAEIAQRHLTPAAKKNIDRYTGAVPLASFSSWMDEVAGIEPYKTMLAGYHASICTSDCTSPLYIRNLYRNCRDGVSALELYTECLKDYRQMPDSLVLIYIKAMTHIVGDFHCPAHVRYTDEVNELKYPVIFFGKSKKFHGVWDSDVIQLGSGFRFDDYKKYADRLDNWDRRRIRQATEGWAREWFEDAARDVRPIIRTVPENAEIGQEFVDGNLELAELELRKAGYQLAKLLNTIFK